MNHLMAANNVGCCRLSVALLSVAGNESKRQFSVSARRPGWFYDYLTKDPKDMKPAREYFKFRPKWQEHGPEAPLKAMLPGNPDDPELMTMDKDYGGSPRFGDKLPPMVSYRYIHQQHDRDFLDRFVHQLLGTMFWAWFFYTLYWRYYEIWGGGDFYLPYHYEWTDEELGIPPDDAPDPVEGQFWGHPGQLQGTYRA